jgi:hypothetical protein
MANKQITLVKYYSNKKFDNNNFDADAIDLFNSDSNQLGEDTFTPIANVRAYTFKGIDPHLQEDGNVKVLFNYDVEWED